MMLYSFKNHPLAREIDNERHRQFMREALPHLIGGMLTGFLIFLVYRSFSSNSAIASWFVLQFILLSCTLTFYGVNHKFHNMFSGSQWSGIIFLVSLIWGVTWALAPFIFLQEQHFSEQQNMIYVAALLIITIALTITPAPAMVYYPAGYFIFATLPLWGVFIRLYQLEYNLLLISFLLFFWITAVGYGWRLHQTLIDSIRLRLEVDEARQQAESATVAKSKFLAASSHDLRQPLQAISLFFNVIKQKLPTGDVQITADKMESSIDSMSQLLDSLLDVSRLDANSIEPHPQHLPSSLLLDKLANDYRALCSDKGLQFQHSLTAATLHADPVLFHRVISNILSNAVNYTHKGSVELNGKVVDQHYQIEIRDSGIGIAADQQQAIFTEFHQLNNPERDQKKGLGLGLSIVRRLCVLQNWDIQLQSTPGKGSCFTLTLPLGDQSQVATPKPVKVNQQLLNNKRVLLVEDDQQVREALIELLSSWGAKVIDGESASQIQAVLPTDVQPADLIISDFRLRENNNGIDAIATLRDHYEQDIPALLITGDTDPQRIEQAKNSGLVVLHKPVRAAQLRLVIQRLLK